MTNVGNDFHENYIEITDEMLFVDEGLKRLSAVYDYSNGILVSVFYYDYENYDSVLENLKEEYAKRNGQVIFTVNYYDVVKNI